MLHGYGTSIWYNMIQIYGYVNFQNLTDAIRNGYIKT